MIHIIHFILLFSAIYLIGRKQPEKSIFFVAMFLKIMAGFCVGWIYLNYYQGADTWRYYNSAAELANLPFAEWSGMLLKSEIGYFQNQPRAILFTKIVSVVIVITQGDYWIVSAYLSFPSALAFWFFFRQVRTTIPNIKWPVVVGFLLLPSTLFWSAGILKGVLTNASFIYIAAFTLKLFYRKKIHAPEIVLVALSLTLLFFIKYYLLIVLLPVAVYALFDRRAFRLGIRKPVRAGVYVIISIATLLIAPLVNPNLDVRNLPHAIHLNQQKFAKAPDTNSKIGVLTEPTWSSLLSTAPRAAMIGLFGPTLVDKGSVWSLIPKIENMLLVVFSILSLYFLFKQNLWQPDILVIASLALIMILAIFLPLAAPNFGTMVRYKAPFTPFLTTLVLILPCWFIQNRNQNA